MKKLIPPVLAVAFILVGCGEPCPHYNRTSVVSLTGQATEIPSKEQGKIKPYGSVQLFENKADITKPYEIIAILTVSGNLGEEAKFMKAFEYRAADLGADGVIFYRGVVTPGVNFNGLFYNSTQNASFRGEAIRFK